MFPVFVVDTIGNVADKTPLLNATQTRLTLIRPPDIDLILYIRLLGIIMRFKSRIKAVSVFESM